MATPNVNISKSAARAEWMARPNSLNGAPILAPIIEPSRRDHTPTLRQIPSSSIMVFTIGSISSTVQKALEIPTLTILSHQIPRELSHILDGSRKWPISNVVIKPHCVLETDLNGLREMWGAKPMKKHYRNPFLGNRFKSYIRNAYFAKTRAAFSQHTNAVLHFNTGSDNVSLDEF